MAIGYLMKSTMTMKKTSRKETAPANLTKPCHGEENKKCQERKARKKLKDVK